MKSIATLLGWIAIGAIVTIAGQQVWKQFKTDNPERSDEISKNVREKIQQGAETIQQTAEAVAEKTKPEPVTESKVAKVEPESAPVAEVAKDTNDTPPALPSLGPAKPIQTAKDTRTSAEKKEDAITERFYKLADDKPETVVAKASSTSEEESASAYQERQEVYIRQEDILLERQMRIVDELAAE